MPSHIDPTGWMKTQITSMQITVSNENTFGRVKIKLCLGVVSQIRIAAAPKCLEECIIRLFMEKFLKWRNEPKGGYMHVID